MISYPWDSIVEAIGDDGFPIYDRDYKAADLQSLNGRIFSNGVFMDEPDAFVVTPAEGMNVILSTGWCCINGTFGNEPNMRELAIQSSASTQDRIDTVVLRWNANIEMRNIDVYVKTGVASDVPLRPTLTRDSTVYELGIADIFVPRGSGAISAARITDTRLQTDRCGAVTPFMQIDTTTFFDQIQAAIDERTAELEKQTAKAVELAQNAIDGTTAGNLQSQIDANKEAIEDNKAEDDERWDSISQIDYVYLDDEDQDCVVFKDGRQLAIANNTIGVYRQGWKWRADMTKVANLPDMFMLGSTCDAVFFDSYGTTLLVDFWRGGQRYRKEITGFTKI